MKTHKSFIILEAIYAAMAKVEEEVAAMWGEVRTIRVVTEVSTEAIVEGPEEAEVMVVCLGMLKINCFFLSLYIKTIYFL